MCSSDLEVLSCLDSKATERDIDRSVAEGDALGVDGLPTVFLNGRKLRQIPWQALNQILALELKHQIAVPDAGEKCCEEKAPKLVK